MPGLIVYAAARPKATPTGRPRCRLTTCIRTSPRRISPLCKLSFALSPTCSTSRKRKSGGLTRRCCLLLFLGCRFSPFGKVSSAK
eukprot:3790015-Rhodomonas_salina.1